MAVKIQLRGDTEANWTSANPIISEREPVISTDVTYGMKIGNGTSRWLDLPYVNQGAKGDAGEKGTATCKQSAQITNNSNTTPTSITGMAHTLVANHRYYFKFLMTFQSAATTTGIGFVFTSPAMSFANWKVKIRQAAAGTDSYYENDGTALTTILVATATLAANTDYLAIVEGYCEPTENGTLQLQVRSEINASQVLVKNQGIGFLVDAG